MTSSRMSALLLAVVVALAADRTLAATYYVAPDGNDSWSGNLPRPNTDKTNGPVATLDGALHAMRYLRAMIGLTQPMRIVVGEGTYWLDKPLVLGFHDRGLADMPIVIEAAPGAKPVFSGGRQIRGFQRAEKGVWKTKIPEVAAGKWYFEQLYVNGRRAVRARAPNEFYYYGPVKQ